MILVGEGSPSACIPLAQVGAFMAGMDTVQILPSLARPGHSWLVVSQCAGEGPTANPKAVLTKEESARLGLVHIRSELIGAFKQAGVNVSAKVTVDTCNLNLAVDFCHTEQQSSLTFD